MAKRRQAIGGDPLAGIDSERLALLLGEQSESPSKGSEPPILELPLESPDDVPPSEEAPLFALSPSVASTISPPRWASSVDAPEAEELIDDREKLLRLADQHAARGDHSAAVELLASPFENKPEDLEIALRLARAHGRLTAYREAEAILHRVLRIDPRSAQAHCEMGIVLAKRGRCDAAIEELRRALELDPGLASGHYYVGICLNQLDQLDEAIEALKRAIALDPEDDRAHYHLGIVYDRKAMTEEARGMYRRAREITDARAHRG